MERGCVCAAVSLGRVQDRRDNQRFFSCSKRSVVKTESDGRTSVGILALARLQPRAGRSNQGRSVRRCRPRRRLARAISCSFFRPAWPCRVGDGIIMRSAANRVRTWTVQTLQVPLTATDWSPLLQMIRGDGNFLSLPYLIARCHPQPPPTPGLHVCIYIHLHRANGCTSHPPNDQGNDTNGHK